MRLLIDEWVQRTTSFFARLSAAVGIGAPRTHFADQVFVELTRELDAMELGPNPFEARTDGSPRKPVQSIVWALVRYQLEREAAAKLGEILIDSAPLMIDPETIQRVELARAGERAVIAESGGVLRAVTPAYLPATAIAELAQALAGLRVEAALHTGKPRPEEGFDNPTLDVRVERRPGTGPPLSFQIGAAGEHCGRAAFFARTRGEDATFVIAQDKLHPLLDLLWPRSFEGSPARTAPRTASAHTSAPVQSTLAVMNVSQATWCPEVKTGR